MKKILCYMRLIRFKLYCSNLELDKAIEVENVRTDEIRLYSEFLDEVKISLQYAIKSNN